MRTHAVCAGLAGAVTIVAMAGCSSTVPLHLPWDIDTWSYRNAEDDPIILDVGGPISVDVESFNGSVTIKADDKLDKATIRIVREATHGFRRRDEADASLAEIDYAVELIPSQLGHRLAVRTWTIHPEPHFQRAHVYIEAPAVDGVTVRTRRGSVYATDIEGIVEIETSEGDVRVMTSLPLRQAVSISNREGDIDYRVRGESSGAFDCEAVRGQVDYRVLYGRLIVHRGTDHDSMLATFNNGTNPIRLRTVDGNIRIAIVHNPTRVGTFIFHP